MNDNKLIIRPNTKVGELLDVYPQLEDVLIKMVPAFKKLKNPILRKTIARVTSLQQASVVGKIDLKIMLSGLRETVGQLADEITEEEQNYFKDKPDWFDSNKIEQTINVARLLNEGENPLGVILNAANNMQTDLVLKIIHEFVPAPIIDELVNQGYDYWLRKDGEIIEVYFKKNN